MNAIFQVLTLAWSFQGGVLPELDMGSILQPVYLNHGLEFVAYSFEATYPVFSGRKDDVDGMYVGSSLENVFTNGVQLLRFSPIQDTYKFSAGVRWGGLTLGWDQICTHSIETVRDNKVASQYLFGDMTRVFLKVEGKM